MKMPAPGFLISCGAAVAAAVSYDASVISELLGMSRYGAEGVVVVTALALSGLFIALGVHGLIRQLARASSRRGPDNSLMPTPLRGTAYPSRPQ